MAENKVEVCKQPPEVVFGCFYMFTRFHFAKSYLTIDIMCQTYVESVEYFYYKNGHMTQKTTVII